MSDTQTSALTPALADALADVVSLAALEEARAKRAPVGTLSCAGCGCVRFVEARCALCGAHR